MLRILFLAAEPVDAAALRLGEELRAIREKLQLSKARDQFELCDRMSVRPSDISQALLDIDPHIVHFSGHGTSTGALCVQDRVGQVQPIAPEALAALFEQFARQVSCVVLNACYSTIQAEAISEHIPYVIGMNEAIDTEAARAFSVGFYQALGAERSIEDAYKLGCVQIMLEGIPEHLTPTLRKGSSAPRSDQIPTRADVQKPPVRTPVVKPPSVARPTNLRFDDPTAGGFPAGWFDSLGFVDYVSTAYQARVVPRTDREGGFCVLFRNPKATPEEFGSLMQRCPALHLAGSTVRFEGEVRTRYVEKWAGLWLRADGEKEFNLFFDNMSRRPIRDSTPWTTYAIEASLPSATTWLSYGIVLAGSGTMWADNFRLLVWNQGRWTDV